MTRRSRAWTITLAFVIALGGCDTRSVEPSDVPLVHDSTVRSPSWELRLTADDARYDPWSDVQVDATITYLGPDESVELACDRPLSFGFRQWNGPLALGSPESGTPLYCEPGVFDRGAAHSFPYSGLGHSFSMDDPNEGAYTRILSKNPGTVVFPAGISTIHAWFGSADIETSLAVSTYRAE